MHHTTKNRTLESLQNIKREAEKVQELLSPAHEWERKTEQLSPSDQQAVGYHVATVMSSIAAIRDIVWEAK